MEQNKSIFYSLRDRSCGLRERRGLRRSVLGSKYLVKRLKCEHVFVGHEGCVNTVAWNETGDILLSGSDDCKLNMYRLTSMKPVHSIKSGHRANIFSAKFLPGTGDTKVVSCSGDGILHYNDVNSHSFYGHNPFRCHTGTTYEVNTIPGDAHSFLSSGEDGTVRLFDLRSKTKCLCEGCKEDVLIDCEKAVTSFSMNPAYPYYVAVGCENSMLRIYDRRFLATDRKSNNKLHGLVHQYKPKALERQDCRVTSLKYSSDGQSLLASFCSDYIYIFDANPTSSNRTQSSNTTDERADGTCLPGANDPPMKRLRLRGDWSDTGPNSRPECEDSGNSENTFVQRMSGYLTRWIEESLQSTQRQRRRNPTTPPARPEEAHERSIHREQNPDPSTLEGAALHHGDDETDVLVGSDVTQETCYLTSSTNSSQSEAETPKHSRDGKHVERSCSLGVAYKNDGKTCAHAQDDDISGECSTVFTSAGIDDKTNNSESSSQPHNDCMCSSAVDSDSTQALDTGNKSPGETTCSSATTIIGRGNKDRQGTDGELGDNTEQQLISGTHSGTIGELRLTTEDGSTNTEIKRPVLDLTARAYVPCGTEDLDGTAQESETDVDSSRTNRQSGSNPRSREVSVGDPKESEDADQETKRNLAASTIQNFFRYRQKNNWTSQCGVPVFSEAKQIFRGHRNARTMIKEANFWGDDFILSGSDCGRIFIWSKDTAELVMLLEGDRHVVNCVQPHPYDPILATSGIDYDVKLWTPTTLNVSSMEKANEVIACNEKMLKESRDTLTVPASFMIRVLSSLHRVRVNTMGNDESSGDSDSDSEENDLT